MCLHASMSYCNSFNILVNFGAEIFTGCHPTSNMKALKEFCLIMLLFNLFSKLLLNSACSMHC